MSPTVLIRMIVAFITAITTFLTGPIGGTKDDVCMIGHRGYSGVYPDNTELAFSKAVENGFGGCETDVRITSDGVFVLSHDGDATFEDGTSLTICDHTYEELTAKPLKNKDTKDTVYICTFRRYLEIMEANDMICFIELKGDYTKDQVKAVFTLADEVYDLDKCILQSFQFENLISARELFPELPLMLTYGRGDTGYERCFEYNISIDADYGVLTSEMVEEFHSHGLQVAAWTCNDIFSLTYCKSLGIDFIESDYFG